MSSFAPSDVGEVSDARRPNQRAARDPRSDDLEDVANGLDYAFCILCRSAGPTGRLLVELCGYQHLAGT